MPRILPISRTVVWFVILLFSCQSSTSTSPEKPVVISGETMGTTYRVLYYPTGIPVAAYQLDSLLVEINNGVSTYIPESVISAFNQSDTDIILPNKQADRFAGNAPALYFEENYDFALSMYLESGGHFDPTVMPLVNYWGFGYQPRKTVNLEDSMVIDSMMAFVGMDKISKNTDGSFTTYKKVPGTQLDFSASAKGYGVDRIGLLLESKGIKDYLVEIGGEVRGRGKKPNGQYWRIGINKPEEGAEISEFEQLIELRELSMATSGNYRNYYEWNGRKFSHTINPFTGYPERSNLLSATIISKDCMKADAAATACMVMGFQKATSFVERDTSLDAFFIYADEDGEIKHYSSEGARLWLID